MSAANISLGTETNTEHTHIKDKQVSHNAHHYCCGENNRSTHYCARTQRSSSGVQSLLGIYVCTTYIYTTVYYLVFGIYSIHTYIYTVCTCLVVSRFRYICAHMAYAGILDDAT